MLVEFIPNLWLRILLAIAIGVVVWLATFGAFVVMQMWKERDQ